MKILFHKAGSVSRQLASGLHLVAFLPHQEPPIHNRGSPTRWDPSPPTSAESKLRPGVPGWGQAGVTRPQFQRGSQGRSNGPVASGRRPMGRSPSGEALAGWIRATSEAALIGAAVTVWGRGEPRASRPGAALSCPAHPGVWPSALAFWAVRPQPRPPWSCIQASAASGAQTPRAISAPELLIFLKRLAALTAMKFFWGRVERGPSQHRGS